MRDIARAARESKDRIRLDWARLTMLAAASVILVGAGIGVALGYPKQVSEPRLGADWQCTRTAFFVTTCTRSEDPAVSTAISLRQRSQGS